MSKWIATLLAGLATACTLTPVVSRAETVTLDVQYAWPSHKRFHEPLAAEFMKLHPDIKINFLAPAASYTDGQQRIMRSAVTGNLPDIWYSGYSYLGEAVRKLKSTGHIADLAPFLSTEGGDWVKSNYSDNVLKLGQVDGQQWGMPFTASTPIVYYNADLLKSAGETAASLKTWDGVIRTAKKISEAGKADGMSYAVNAWGDDWLWQALVLNNGGQMLKPDGKTVAFGDASGLRAATLIRRFVTETKMPFLDEDQSIQQFAAGKLGIFIGSTAEVRVMGDAVGNKFTFATAPYPAAVEGEGGLAVGGSAAIILAKDEAKRKAAWEFLKFVTGPAGQKIVVLGSGYMPTNLRTAGADYLGDFYAKNPDWTTSMSQWPIAKSWAGYPGAAGPRIWDEQKVILSGIMRGETTPADGLKAMVEVTDRLAAAAN